MRPIVAVIAVLMIDVMVASQHAIRQSGIFQHLHVLVGNVPLVGLIGVIDDVAGVEHILDVQLILLRSDPVDNVFIYMWIALRIILRIGHPDE
ncbi:hypothetical protein D3C75_1223480 [compost metagenome]